MLQKPLMSPSTEMLVDSYIKNPSNTIGFNGPNNSGKLRIAEYLCQEVLNISLKEFDFNVEIIDCASQGGIDDIRDLKKRLAIKSVGKVNSFSRAVILDSFDKISIPAQNSILKLLEEPPVDTVLMILVDSKSNILSTIISRLQWVDVLPLNLEILEKNYSQYDSKSIQQAYLLSDGYLINFEDILKEENNTLRLAVDDAKKILKLDKVGRISSIDGVLNNQSYGLEDFLDALKKIYLTLLHREVAKDSKLQNKILSNLDHVNRTKEALAYNVNTKLVMTDLFYKI